MKMSQIKTQQPAIHIPSFKKWGIQRHYFLQELEKQNLDWMPKDFVLDSWYYYSNLEGWGKILYDLAFSSNLYKTDIFDCEDYALKAQVVCAERYGLNALRFCIGFIPQGGHGFNLLFYGDETGIGGTMLWEPNAGFEHSGEAFVIGEYGYQPKLILI